MIAQHIHAALSAVRFCSFTIHRTQYDRPS